MSNICVTVTATGTSTESEVRIRRHTLVVDRPESKEGGDKGPMGGELLLAALGGCFASTLLAAAAGRGITLGEIVIVVDGDLITGPQRFGAIRMTLSAAGCDDGTFAHLVEVAERGCIVANTLKQNIALSISVSTQIAT